jgi:hypothetical protein
MLELPLGTQSELEPSASLCESYVEEYSVSDSSTILGVPLQQSGELISGFPAAIMSHHPTGHRFLHQRRAIRTMSPRILPLEEQPRRSSVRIMAAILSAQPLAAMLP